MKKIWKRVALAALIFLVAGGICLCVSLYLGGSLNRLYQNAAVQPLLEQLSSEHILDLLSALLGQ